MENIALEFQRLLLGLPYKHTIIITWDKLESDVAFLVKNYLLVVYSVVKYSIKYQTLFMKLIECYELNREKESLFWSNWVCNMDNGSFFIYPTVLFVLFWFKWFVSSFSNNIFSRGSFPWNLWISYNFWPLTLWG